MMQSLGGAMTGMGGRRPAAKQQPKKKKGNHKVSGNPAKRTGGGAAALPPAASAPTSAFGLPTQPTEADLAKAVGDFQLPAELQQLFNPKNAGPR